jgi:hypothetical protein
MVRKTTPQELLVNIAVSVDDVDPRHSDAPRYLRVAFTHPHQYPIENQLEIQPEWTMAQVQQTHAPRLVEATWQGWFLRTAVEATDPKAVAASKRATSATPGKGTTVKGDTPAPKKIEADD